MGRRYAEKKFHSQVPRRRKWEPKTGHSQFFEAILSSRIVDRRLPFRVWADMWSVPRCAGGGSPVDHADSSEGLRAGGIRQPCEQSVGATPDQLGKRSEIGCSTGGACVYRLG